MKLGSLFDGIGGFPLAGMSYGITPVWASEIEPFPIKVTQYHFPQMKHLGNITKVNGAEIEPVDIITFGSPCQDLSVAGKRAGLDGERSGLFAEAIRIINEMRCATDGNYPRFAVWENVPGAFSSNGGQDFRAVLESFTNTTIPMPISGGWADAGMVRTASVDIAWRVLDAQYWGVPQRRRRIFLVADFGGQCADEILFKPEGLRGDIAEGRETREEVAGDVGEGSIKPMCIRMREGCAGGGKGPLISENKSLTLGCSNDQSLLQPLIIEPRARADECRLYTDGIVPTLQTMQGGQKQPCVMAPTLDANVNAKWGSNQWVDQWGECLAQIASIDCRNLVENKELSGTLQHKESGGYSLNYQNPVRIGYRVRRLTPLECERLQGYPDGWTDVEGAKDTARYKALGNSVARVCVDYVLDGIARVS